MTHVRVDRPLEDLQLRAGRNRAGLEAAADLLAQLVEPGDGWRAHHPLSGDMGRDDVRCLATGLDDAVHAVAGGQGLAQQGHRDLGDDHRVRSINAALRKRARVSGPTGVRDLERLCGEDFGQKQVGRPRMDHQRAVDVVEDALLDHDDLAAAALLCRRADHADRDVERFGNGREGDPGPDRGGRDDVVAAGMANFGQRVVLGDDRDVQRPGSVRAHERRLEIRDVALDAETGLLEPLDEPAAGHRFLEVELGIGLDPVRQADERFVRALHALAGNLFEVVSHESMVGRVAGMRTRRSDRSGGR